MVLERAVLKKAQHYNIRLISPNCLGVIRPDIALNASKLSFVAFCFDCNVLLDVLIT